MIIPKRHRKLLKSVGHPKLTWVRIWDWAFGERYRFRDGSLAYLKNDEIITIRRGDSILWRKEDLQWMNE